MMLRILLYLLAASCVFAQTPGTAPPAEVAADPRTTPRGSIFGFLEACRTGDYRRAASFLADGGGRNGPERARQLRHILDRGLRTDPSTLSNAPEGDLTDGLAPQFELLGTVRVGDDDIDLLLERVTAETLQVWVVSSRTVQQIPRIFESLNDTWVESVLPWWLKTDGPLDTPIWVWVALLLLIALSVSLASLLARILVHALRPAIRRTATDFDDELVHLIINPFRLLMGLAAFRAGMAALSVSILLRTYLGRIVTALIYFALAWIAIRVIDLVAARAVAGMTGRQRATASSIVPLGTRTAKAAAIVIALLATLHNWGYNTTALLAGLGVGGLAIALAAQKTIENLFGGVAITTDKPVLIGDFCRYGDKFGIVEDIGLRSTRVRTLDRTLVTIPNAHFSSLEIENYGQRDKIWFHPIIQLRRDTTPDQMRRLISGFREILLSDDRVDPLPARVRFVSLGTYSLDIEIFAYVKTTAIDEYLVVQEDLFLRILDLIEAVGTGLAVPSQLNLLGRDPMRQQQRMGRD